MEIIDAFTILAALVALNNTVFFATQLPKRRYGVYILFLLSLAQVLEYGRTALSSGFGLTDIGYGTPASYATRLLAIAALLSVNIVIWRYIKGQDKK